MIISSMRIFFLAVSILTICTICIPVEAKSSRKSSHNAFNIEAKVDSAIMMVDDYIASVIEKPEMSKIRLNGIKNFYECQSVEVRDSIRSSLFDFIKYYIENGNNSRAHIFADCYKSLATPTDIRLGNIYAAEITLAVENQDTTEIKRIIPMLEKYSGQTGLDFDEEISEANDYLEQMRDRQPINLDLMGVWVSERLCEDLKFHENVLVSLFSLDTPNSETHNEIFYRLSNPYYIGITADRIVIGGPSCYKDLPRFGYKIPQEIVSMGKYENEKSYKFERLSPNSWLYKDDYFEVFPQVMQYDESHRSAYCIWSNELVNSFNPDYYAQIRQNMQYNTAEAIGNMSRKNVSAGTKLWGSAALTAMDHIGNAIIDRLAVSSATFWMREMTVNLVSPNELRVWIYTQYNRTKSNSGNTQTRDKNLEGIKYYKWEPEDNVYFIRGNGIVVVGSFNELPKDRKKEIKSYIKEQKDIFQSRFGKIGSSQKKYDEFERWFNSFMFDKLKNKASQK